MKQRVTFSPKIFVKENKMNTRNIHQRIFCSLFQELRLRFGFELGLGLVLE